MKERPILFNTEMVRAILDGRKTKTRRVLRDQSLPMHCRHCDGRIFEHKGYPIGHVLVECPLGEPDDRLWVRETWFPMQDIEACIAEGEPIDIVYKADWDADGISRDEARDVGVDRWCPSIHMPRWASRITLEITDVRVERVQDITANGARAEGVFSPESSAALANPDRYALFRFSYLWDSINSKRGYGWDANPWVWVIEFKLAVMA